MTFFIALGDFFIALREDFMAFFIASREDFMAFIAFIDFRAAMAVHSDVGGCLTRAWLEQWCGQNLTLSGHASGACGAILN